MSGAFYPLGFADGMSEGEYQAQCAEPNNDDPPPALNVPAGTWRTRNGRELVVRKMPVEHLKNAIKLFTHAGWGDHMKIRELREELGRRGA